MGGSGPVIGELYLRHVSSSSRSGQFVACDQGLSVRCSARIRMKVERELSTKLVDLEPKATLSFDGLDHILLLVHGVGRRGR
jgi:hypothetical protein